MTRPRGIVPRGLLTQPIPLPWVFRGPKAVSSADKQELTRCCL